MSTDKEVSGLWHVRSFSHHHGRGCMKHVPLVHLLLISLLLLVLAGCGNNAPVPPPPEPSPTSGPVDPAPIPGPTPDPTPPPSEASISGTLFAPSGGDVTEALVGACAVVDESFDCSAPSTVVTTITQSGSTAPYTLAAPAGDYVVVAQQDVDGNGTIDYEGGYGYEIVIAPAQGIDITLLPVDRGTGGVNGNEPHRMVKGSLF